MTIVGGIDQSKTGFGWAVGSDEIDSVPKWGVINLGQAGSNEGLMYELCAQRVRAMRDMGVQKIFFEKPIKFPHDKIAGDMIKFGVPAIILHTCYLLKIPCAWVEVDDWRDRFHGTNKAPPGLTQQDARRQWWKETAISTCLQRGWIVDDDNAAEALGIMDYGLCTLSRKYQSRTDPVFRRLQVKKRVLL